MQALHDVVKAGYVRYIGMSSCYAWQCKHYPSLDSKIPLIAHCDFYRNFFYVSSPRDAEYVVVLPSFLSTHSVTLLKKQIPDYAINNGLTPFISMQNHYNLIYREEEREMFPTLQAGLQLSEVWAFTQ